MQKGGKEEQRLIQKDSKALDACSFDKALTKYNCKKCTTTTSTTQEKDNNSACNNVPSYMECIWNWFFIGQQPYQTMNHWWLIKASNDSFWMCWQFTTFISHLYIKEWRLEERRRLNNNLKAPKLYQNCSASKSSLKISFQNSYLRNSRVLKNSINFSKPQVRGSTDEVIKDIVPTGSYEFN